MTRQQTPLLSVTVCRLFLFPSESVGLFVPLPQANILHHWEQGIFFFFFFFFFSSFFFFFFFFLIFAGGRAGSILSTHLDKFICSALHFMSTSKSSTSSLVSSVPFRLPTAHTSFVFEALIRHTTPPLPPLSNVTRFRINSPVFKSQSFTVPSSELVITKFLLNCKQVTALWCLLGPRQNQRNLITG